MNSPRLLAALLALSLAGHAVWLWHGTRGQVGDPVDADHANAPAPSAGAAAGGSHRGDASSADGARALLAALAAEDLAAFRDLLAAAGVSPELRKQLLLVAIQHRFQPRMDAIQPGHGAELPKEWWRNPDYRAHSIGRADLDRLQAINELHQEMNAEITRLTGEDPFGFDPVQNPWLARQFAGLPPEKAEALHRIHLDYQELEQQINLHAMGFELAEDEAKLRLLREERERDIAALLTPEERAEWELRASPTADRARHLATEYQASEEEYRRIYALQKAVDNQFDPEAAAARGHEIDWEKHHAAQEELQKQIRSLVGEDRYLAARRASQLDHLLARSAAERLGLPADTAERIVGLREPAATESQRIAADPSLGPEQKRAALARLAADTRAQVTSSLGPDAAAAYFKRGGMNWLAELEKGSRLVMRDENPATEPVEGVYQDGHAALPPRGIEPIEPLPIPVIRID